MELSLEPKERAKVELHTVYGAGILQQMIDLSTIPDPRMEMARAIALNHHQCWDGSGYPAFLTPEGKEVVLSDSNFNLASELRTPAGGEIPLEALIVSLADNYDALRSTRHYKPEFSHEKAVSIIVKDDRTGAAGEQRFGKDLYKVFIDNAEEFNQIYNAMR
jgi:HD-GYP domain-containing protein (c-di-GMP phosphodiesterase class II)